MKRILLAGIILLTNYACFAQGSVENFFFPNNGRRILYGENSVYNTYERSGNEVVKLSGIGNGWPVSQELVTYDITDTKICVVQTEVQNKLAGKQIDNRSFIVLQMPVLGQIKRWSYSLYDDEGNKETFQCSAELKVIKDADNREIEIIKIVKKVTNSYFNRTWTKTQYWGKGYGLLKDDGGKGQLAFYSPVMSGTWEECPWYDIEKAKEMKFVNVI